jgi:hypothetical protein
VAGKSSSLRDRPCRHASAAANIEHRFGGVDIHGVQVLVHHRDEARMLSACLQPRDDDVKREIVELVGNAIYVDRTHRLSFRHLE